MMLLKSDANAEAGVMPDERLLTDMTNYNMAMAEAGVLRSGEGLRPSSEGAKVRIEHGKTRVIDGPFAEAKEVVAGYFMIEVKSLAEAKEWALRIPGEPSNPEGEGEIELRPLFETEDFPVDAAEQEGGWREKELEARKAPPVPGSEKGARWISFLKADKNTESHMLPSEKLLQEMGDLIQEMTDKGVLISGEGLKPSAEAAKVRIKNKKRSVIDGPFTESKELIAGFSMFRAQTKAEAIEWARRCLQIHMDGTGIGSGEIEVRRVFETEEIPVTDAEKPGGWRDQEQRLREQLEK
ncbi:MAG TPA: YciI family protein [Polyangiales bacterium]|nr:YciI family protein [Polyangiales bacterium]